MTLEAERCEQCGFMIPGWAREEHEAGHLAALPAARVEELAALFHGIYQREAKRQGNVRHPDTYRELPENVKEFDRALARFVLLRDDAIRAEAQPAQDAGLPHESPYSEYGDPRDSVAGGNFATAQQEQSEQDMPHRSLGTDTGPGNAVARPSQSLAPAPDAKWDEAVTRIVNCWLMTNGTKSDLIAALLAAGQSAQPVVTAEMKKLIAKWRERDKAVSGFPVYLLCADELESLLRQSASEEKP